MKQLLIQTAERTGIIDAGMLQGCHGSGLGVEVLDETLVLRELIGKNLESVRLP